MERSLNFHPAEKGRRELPHGKKLLWSRLLWTCVVMLALATFFLTIPVRFGQLVKVAVENRSLLMEMGLSPNFLVGYLVLFDTTAMLTFCLIAGVIAWHKSDDRLALFGSAMLVLMSVLLTRPVESTTAVPPVWRLPYVLTLALGIAAVILFMFIFPDGRFIPGWSRWIFGGWLCWVLSWYLLPIFLIHPMPWPPKLQPGTAVLGWVSSGLLLQFLRYRFISTTAQKQQTKWVLLGLITSSVGFITYLYLAPVLLPSLARPGFPHLYYILFGVPLLYLSLLLLPITIGVSITRYRLWDIGVLVNRTMVYGVLTVMLTAVYLAGVLLLQPLFSKLTNDESLPVIAVSTLATAVLFYPLRQRVQTFIDMRLFPQKYEANRLLNNFQTILRSEIILSNLIEHLEHAVSHLLKPTSVFTWLGTPTGFRVHLVDKFPSTETPSAWINSEIPHDDPLFTYLNRCSNDILLLEQLEFSSTSLTHLKYAGISLLLPLRGQGEVVGWLGLGPRLSQHGFSADDLKFLGDVAAVAGPAIRLAQLAHEQQAMALTQQQLSQEMHLAKVVQQTLLPHQSPTLAGWDVAAFYQPAQAVGGDFYDFIQFDDGRFGLIIGDVSDKGIPAALLMAATRSLLRSLAYQCVTPSAVLEQANRLLLPDLPAGLFVTCLYALLDPANGRLLIANAGHNPPTHRSGSGNLSELWITGMPLGWLPETTYQEQVIHIDSGDSLLFYSDGVTEAGNHQGEQWGIRRLHERLTQTATSGAKLIEYLMSEVSAFTYPNRMDDDVTIVTVRRVSHV